jgi:hypothetical protein
LLIDDDDNYIRAVARIGYRDLAGERSGACPEVIFAGAVIERRLHNASITENIYIAAVGRIPSQGNQGAITLAP